MALTFTLTGLQNNDDVNRLTTALMELEGVETVQVAREWLEVEGRASERSVMAVIEQQGFGVRR
ncbi:hypothetical protein [Kushneria aurantia]|uniref:HMA domain-containing protein n=1 Tax=Kushneria aurantia TaxID=504092 RepID=A0ABV6G474_9GAMM|nr:hypothetical protein [Kushneria aurantia]